jgi:hypothetical protein
VHPENQRQADFFCGKLNGITFPYSSGGIHFLAFFVKLLGTKNSMIFAIDHPTCKNKTEAKKFLILTNLYRCLQAVSPEDIRILSIIALVTSTFPPTPCITSSWNPISPADS